MKSQSLVPRLSKPSYCFEGRNILDKYLIKRRSDIVDSNENFCKHLAFTDPNVNVRHPNLCTYDFMNDHELEDLFSDKEEKAMKRKIGKLCSDFKL